MKGKDRFEGESVPTRWPVTMGEKLICHDKDCSTSGSSVKLVHRQSRLCSTAGFTLVELMVAMLIMGVILSISLPQLAVNLEHGRKAKCLSTRYHIDQDERAYYTGNNNASLTIDSRYQCPSGGICVWLVADPAVPEYPRVGCSLHYGQAAAALTSLGSTFTEITTGMSDLITKYYQQNSKYPASVSDLGLNSAEWAKPVNGLYYAYSPQTGAVVVAPTTGFTMTVNNLQGKSLTIYPDSKKNLEYVLSDGTWYYFTDKNKNNAVDISTLQVLTN
ncbi:MAG: Prepilin-type N-terminal cleavage/methylation protein [Thermodesulfobacteriota bacterium]|nr:Prepilin-type N-terminal cleavage/methylation protein [Thermodesulfobacteriota bacterium]